MENIGGSLGFKATLNIDDFTVSAHAMERQIRNFSHTAVDEVVEVESAIEHMSRKAGEYISYYLVGQGMKNLVTSIVQTRGQFQQLEIAFETMLGSTEKANALMQQMVDTAAKTPFDLMGVAGGAKQLMAYGVSAEKVNDTLVRLGNIASGLSIPLNDIVYLYGTTMVQGRLYAQDVRQFTGRGIPLVKELAEKYHTTAEAINEMVSAGKIGFADVEEVLNKMTDAGGQFYNLMEKQSASLTGQIANLQDAWDTVLNDWGQAGEGLFSDAIAGATYLVEHMDSLVRILKTVAVAYGSVKAAIILNNVATKGYTGIAVLDNTVRSAKLVLMRAEAKLNGTEILQKEAMTAAEQSHIRVLESSLSTEERAAILKQTRIIAIERLLTAQQQEYLSNIGLTATSEGYEAAAMGVLTAEQRMALSKMDLTTKSDAYKAAIVREIQSRNVENKNLVESLELKQREAAQAVETEKLKLISAKQRVATAKMELAMAQQSGDSSRIANAQKQVEIALDNESATKKRLLTLQSTLLARSKALEAAQTRAAKDASVADTAAKEAQTAATGVLSAATGKLTKALKALWLTMKQNPIGWILTMVGLAVSAFTALSDSTEGASGGMNRFGDASQKQLANIRVLLAVLENTSNSSNTYKRALEELNRLLEENGLTALEAGANIDEVREAYERLRETINRDSAERGRNNARADVQNTYDTGMDNLKNDIYNELKDAHHAQHSPDPHFDLTKGLFTPGDFFSFDSKDIQERADALAAQFQEAISEAVGDMVKLPENELMLAKLQLRQQLTDIMTGAGINEQHAKFISDYSWLDNNFYDVFTGPGGIIDRAIELQRQFDSQMESLNNGTEATANMGEAAEAAAEQIDLTSLSLTQLHELEQRISTTPVEVRVNTYGFEDAATMLQGIQGMIGQRQRGLNTERGLNDEINYLRNLQQDKVYGSQEWRQLDTQITQLRKRLRTEQNDVRAAESLAQKQVEAARRLEEARIAVMEEGYAKRKATLDLQHEEVLDRINREERELINARKKANQGGLTEDERRGFEQRRRYEEQSYARSQNQLFDGEIDYKRRQYELYWRWVENMGKEVADRQFASLLQSGTSFKSYLENQIAELNSKKNAGTISEGESNFLISLNVQYDELIGAKSALDAFRENVQNAINRSQTLAEKLEAVAEAKRKLESGESGLNADDTAIAFTETDTTEADLRRELQDTVMRDYRSFEEQRLSIQREYNTLRQEAQRIGDEERVRLINQGESEALSALNASMLMQSEAWKNLFSDLDALTVSEIDNLVKEIQTRLNTADLQLNPADLKAVLDRLDEAKAKILDTNPFKALGSALSEVFKKQADGSSKSSKQIKTDWRNLASATEGCFNFVNDAIDSCSVLSDLIGESGKETIQMLQGITMGGIAMASAIKSAEKASIVLTAISTALQAVSWIASLFNNDKKYEKKIENLQRNIDALERSCDRLQRAFDKTYWVFTDEEKTAYEKNIEYIEQQIELQKQLAAVAARAWDFAGYAMAISEIKKLNKELSKAKEAGDMLSIYEAQKKSLEQQQELLKQQIEAEQSKKKTDKDKIIQWQNAIEDINRQIEDLEQTMLDTFAGTTTKEALDQFADALVDAYCAGEDAAKALGDTTREVLKKAVVDALKRQFLAKAIDEAVKFLGEALSDGVLSDKDRSDFESMVNAAGETFTNALEAVGDWIKEVENDATTDPLTGAVTSMSEETGGVIAGRLNAFIINQTEQTNVLREQLLAQSEIARNTATANTILTEVRDTLKRIETKDNSLLSQGIS